MAVFARKPKPSVDELAERLDALEAKVEALAAAPPSSGADRHDGEVDRLARVEARIERLRAMKFG